MKYNPSLLQGLRIAVTLSAITINSAHADSATWTGAAADGNLWSNVNNWAGPPGTVPGAGQVATFNTSTGTVDLGAGVTISQLATGASAPSLTIGAGAVNSQTLTLTNSGIVIGSSNTSLAGQTLTINAALSIGSGAVFQSISQPTVNIAGNVTTHAASGTTMLRMNDSGITVNGVISNGATALLGLTLQQNVYTLTNAGNSFTGGFSLENGTVSVNSIGNIGNNSAAGADGVINFGGGFGGGGLTYTGTGNETNRVLNLNHGFNGATINQSGASGNLNLTADLTATAIGSRTLTLSGSAAGTGEFSGRIVDNGTTGTTQVKTGGNNVSTLILNSVDGVTIGSSVSGTGIAGGTTVTAINASTRTITLSTNTTANVAQNADVSVAGVVNVTHLTKNGTGTWTLSGENTHSGFTRVNAGTLTLSNSLALQNSALDMVNSIAGTTTAGLKTTVTTLTLGGLEGTTSAKNLSSIFTTTSGGYNAVTALTLNTRAGASYSYSGAIANGATGMTVTKTGAGTQILGGTSTHTGVTNVSAGTLYVTGALSNSTVTVEANGTIGSNGVAGTLGNGLTIAAGGNLDLTGATLGANSSGILSLTGGNLTLGNLTFQDLVGWDWLNATAGTYELIDGAFTVDFGSTAFTSEGTAYDFGNGMGGYFTQGSLNAVIMNIPEPSVALLGAIGIMALLRRRRD